MRDIRGDLKERAEFIERQINAVSGDFERAAEQLRQRLKAELAALGAAMIADRYRMLLMNLAGRDDGMKDVIPLEARPEILMRMYLQPAASTRRGRWALGR